MNDLLYVCWNKGERVRGSFSCLLDYADNLVKTPLRQLSLFFNGPVRCHTAESFLSVSSVAAGTVATRPGFLFSAVACRCFMEGSWQSIICSACSEIGREAVGEPDCDGWCWEAFSYWPEKLDHIVSYLEKCPIKACQYGPSILLQRLPVHYWLCHWVWADWFICLNAEFICWSDIT